MKPKPLAREWRPAGHHAGGRLEQQFCGSNSVVECHLAKVDVEGSNPFSRSPKARLCWAFFVSEGCRSWKVVLHNPLHNHFDGHDAFRAATDGAVVMPAKAMTLASPVRTSSPLTLL